jgi:hypothetical protein
MGKRSLSVTFGPEDPPVIKAEDLAELERCYGSAQVIAEANFDFVHIEKLKFISDGNEVEVEALLCPQMRDGYATRLFLSQPFPGKGQNWTQHQILGRKWHSWSWQNVPAGQRLVQILLSHLKALK